MSVGLDLLVSIVSAVASVTLTGILALIAWYLRGEYREHKKNTAVRRWLVGDPALEEVDDAGHVDELDNRFEELRGDMEEQHADVDRRLGRVHEAVRRVIQLLEDEHDVDLKRPDGGDEQVSADD